MKIFRFLILILILTLVLVFFVLKRNTFSKEVLKIEIIGPSEIEAGKEVEFLVKYKNNGNFRLEEPQLIFDFPENSFAEGKFLERKILKEELGSAIYPGEERSFSFRAKIFGKEGEAKVAKASLSFRPKNLKAFYSAQTTFLTKIKSVPLTFEFDLPSQIEPQKDFDFKIHYFSNLDSVLENIKILVDFPVGFEILDSKPKPIQEKEWQFSLLNKFEGGRIEIKGRIFGEIGEGKIFRAKFGILKEGKFVVLKETEKGIEIVKPLLYLRQQVNGKPEYVASPGEWLHYEIYFKNVGEENLKNLFLISKLEGEGFDFETIKSETGNFSSGDNSIVFDWRKNPKLEILKPLEEGRVEFWIKLKEDFKGEPILKNKVFLGQAREEFLVKISSKILFSQKGFFQDEVFGNSGPLPPTVGQVTTYTIIWQVKGGQSKFQNLVVKAKLPKNVTLTGKIFPETEMSKFSFDQNSREITWLAGELNPREEKSFAFQVSLLPTQEDRGKILNLIEDTIMSGNDAFSGKNVEVKVEPLNTFLKEDPTINEEKAIVR